jgi:hypothetical protein
MNPVRFLIKKSESCTLPQGRLARYKKDDDEHCALELLVVNAKLGRAWQSLGCTHFGTALSGAWLSNNHTGQRSRFLVCRIGRCDGAGSMSMIISIGE